MTDALVQTAKRSLPTHTTVLGIVHWLPSDRPLRLKPCRKADPWPPELYRRTLTSWEIVLVCGTRMTGRGNRYGGAKPLHPKDGITVTTQLEAVTCKSCLRKADRRGEIR